MDLNLDWSSSCLLDPPKTFIAKFEISNEAKDLVQRVRNQIRDIISGTSSKLLVIAGPCSLHDKASALEYAERLSKLQNRFPNLLIIMRAYFEKPRTVLGWKGLVYDPNLTGKSDLPKGICLAREILCGIVNRGITPATEFLDTILPQYYSDLIVWGAIGARTVESQIHRQLASGLSCPIGFKNSSSGNIKVAIDAAIASRASHVFPGINNQAKACLISTKGNPDTHIILRGSYTSGSNYKKAFMSFQECASRGMLSKVVVDCSHGNSGKDHTRQSRVVKYIANEITLNGPSYIAGLMLESHLLPGSQSISENLSYGISITDSCIGFEETEGLLDVLNQAVENFKNNSTKKSI